MHRIERIHPRHDQRDAREEVGRGSLSWRRICINAEDKNTREHTIALAIRLTDKISYARFEREPDDALPRAHEQRKAQSRLLVRRGVRFRRRRGRFRPRDSVKEETSASRFTFTFLFCLLHRHDAHARHAGEQGTAGLGHLVLI